MYIHANLNWRMGKFIYFLNGPELHRWHHANDDVAAYGKNLGTKFTVWDWMFGTLFNPDRKATNFGEPDNTFPKGYCAQAIFMFRRRVKGAQVI